MSLVRKGEYVWRFVRETRSGELDRSLAFNRYTVTAEMRRERAALAAELQTSFWKSQLIALGVTVCLRLASRRVVRPGLLASGLFSAGFGLACAAHFCYARLEARLAEEMAEVALRIEAERRWFRPTN